MSMQQSSPSQRHPYKHDGLNLPKKQNIQSFSASKKNSIKDQYSLTSNHQQQPTYRNENSQPRVKSLIPKPLPKQQSQQQQQNSQQIKQQSKTFDNQETNNNYNQSNLTRLSLVSNTQTQQNAPLLFSSQKPKTLVQQQQLKQNSTSKKKTSDNNKQQQLPLQQIQQVDNCTLRDREQRVRQQYSQSLLPTQMLSHNNNQNNNQNIYEINDSQKNLSQFRVSDISTKDLSSNNCYNNQQQYQQNYDMMPLQVVQTHSDIGAAWQQNQQQQNLEQFTIEMSCENLNSISQNNTVTSLITSSTNQPEQSIVPPQQKSNLKQPTQFFKTQNTNNNRNSSQGIVQNRESSLQNEYGIKQVGKSRVQSTNNLKNSNTYTNQPYQQKLQINSQDANNQNKRPLSSNNLNVQQSLSNSTNKYSKIGQSINTVLQELQPKQIFSNSSEHQLPKPYPSQQNNGQRVLQQQSQQTPKAQNKNDTPKQLFAPDIPLQLNRLQESLNKRNTIQQQQFDDNSKYSSLRVTSSQENKQPKITSDQGQFTNANTNSQINQKDFLSNRTSCYDREEMDEKYISDSHQNQGYKIVHQNQSYMLKEITNLLKGSSSKANNQQSNIISRHSNDYSITQFNMNTVTTPHHNETYSNFCANKRPSSTVIPNEISHSSFIKNGGPSILLGGEENIQNDESPHKCHSIKTYHISTFFNNNQVKFMNFLSTQQQQQVLRQPVNPSTFNYDYLRTYPKMNFQMPEQKQFENISVSQYETPINQSIPLIIDNTINQQDMSILTNSCLNISNQPEIVSIYGGMNNPNFMSDFGQNNNKRIHLFNQTQNITSNQKDNEKLNLTQDQMQNSQLNLTGPQGQHIKIQNCYSLSDNDMSNEINETQLLSNKQSTQNVEIHRQHLMQTFNALQTIPLLGPYQKSYLRKERIYLPPPKNPQHKKVLLLDIDETMIHCLDERDPENEEPDVVIRIPLDDDGDYADAGINIRPHLYECLKQMNEYYQVITFTASDQQYANAILDFVDPDKSLIAYRLYRQHCIETEFGYIKDLRIIANRDLKDMVLVDNSVLSFALQVENGIPILPFYYSKQDEELLHLIYYLKCLVVQEDVRLHNKDAFGLKKLALMDINQIMKNTTNVDSINDSCDGNSNQDSGKNSDCDKDLDTFSDSIDVMLSPNTKLNNVKQKYQPNDIDQINEESMESDLTSSVMSKRLVGIQQNKRKQQKHQQQSIKSNTSLHNVSNQSMMNQSFNQKQQQTTNNKGLFQSSIQNLYNQQQHNSYSLNLESKEISAISSSTASHAFENFLAGSIRNDTQSPSHHIQGMMNKYTVNNQDYYQVNNMKMRK